MRALITCGLVALAACHDLPDLGTCGNGIVEAGHGEACDDRGPSATCTATCELVCARAAADASYVAVGKDAMGASLYCPGASYRCGADGICRAPSGQFEPLAALLPFDVAGSPVLGDVDNDGLSDLVGTSPTNLVVRFGSATGTPLGDVVVQDAPSSDAPYAIFDLPKDRPDADRPGTMIAIPTEGVALLRSDGERFTPQLDLAISLDGETQGLVVRDPDPAIGDVAIAVQSASQNASITVVRPPLGLLGSPAPLPPCVGATGGRWRTVDVKAAPDRRSFVVVTQLDDATQPAAQPWHVCHYTPAGTTWALTDFELAPPAPSSIVLANVDGDACLELVVRSAGAPGLAMIDAGGTGCGLAPPVVPLPIAGPTGALLAAGQVVPGGADELVLASGVYRACTSAADCGALAAGTLVRSIAPTQVPWSAAALADLNGDGALDVVAAHSGEVGVDVVRGGAVPNIYRVSTAEPVTNLVAGDFDGDRLGDVALVESGPPGDQVAVVFGTTAAIVGAPVTMSPVGGRLRIDRMTEIHWIPSTRGSDGIDDLLVLDLGTAPMGGPPVDGTLGTPAAGLLIGDAARLMTTPRFPPMSTTTGQPLGAVAAGAFGSDDLELLALTGDQAQLYNIMGNNWAPPLTIGMQLHQPVGALRDGLHARGAARGTGDHDVVVFSIRGMFTMCQVTVSGTPRALRGVDIDGDGVDELAVFSEDSAGQPQLQLFRASGCPLAPLLVTELAGCVDVANAGNRLIAICRSPDASGPGGTADPAARQLIAIASPGGQPVITPLGKIDGDARFVTAGDYDGDGVLDIAVSVHRGSGVGVQLLRQCPAHDTRACP